MITMQTEALSRIEAKIDALLLAMQSMFDALTTDEYEDDLLDHIDERSLVSMGIDGHTDSDLIDS